MQTTQAKLSDDAVADRAPTSVCLANITVDHWQTVELFLPVISGVLHVQPVNRPAVIELREISVHGEGRGIVWAARTLPELQNVSTAGPLILLPGKGSCLFFNFGFDPIWVLPRLDEAVAAATLKVVLSVHKDFGAVSEAITAAYADVEVMAAQVRTASAERNRILRDFQRQTEAVVADRNRALRKSEELAGLVQLESQRNVELQSRKDALEFELQALRTEQETLRQTLHSWEQSRSWRITRPLRSASGLAQKLRKNLG